MFILAMTYLIQENCFMLLTLILVQDAVHSGFILLIIHTNSQSISMLLGFPPPEEFERKQNLLLSMILTYKI